MKDSKIEWCDSTFNPWEGCTKVSPGCANCYAETRNARFGGGTANVTTIPAERVPNEVALWAEWTETGTNQKRRAEIPMSRTAITTNPRLFAESVAGQVSRFVKGGVA